VPAAVDKVLTTALLARNAETTTDGQPVLFESPGSSDGAAGSTKDAD
jgi:hypothetical protein